MKRVTGIGGIFFKAKDPEQLRAWYRKHLGIESESWGFTFSWQDDPQKDGGQTGEDAHHPVADVGQHLIHRPGQREDLGGLRVRC